ncbi:SDR family oxidoreductase [uncultured Pseudokineococcus sp.]|uniref:SDR family NAD(P)-dependent oxidoreductase n=1 Tax=uncultured Pseudokineococcus sp. TaxID=1642928 RepID=UPI00262BAD45|nr:SDR family NAD(P)-dependent oxidoreductase [uncultured Pseudokineococcus sp.]
MTSADRRTRTTSATGAVSGAPVGVGDDDLPRVVLVTGASSGIGRATALRLARPGGVLALAARGEEGLAAVAAQCRELGARVSTHALDVGDDAAVEACVADVVRREGRLDAAVTSAAVVAYGDFTEVPAEVFDRVLRTDVLGTANVARHALRRFREQGDGTLLIMGSVLGQISAPWMSAYTTSKWALRGLARALVIENRPHRDVHVRVVSPGGVETPVYRRAATYLGRHGKPPFPVYAPETVADRVVRVLAKPASARRDTRAGWANPVMVAGFTLLPGVYDALVRPGLSVFGLDFRRVADTTGHVFTPSERAEPRGEDAPVRRRTRAAR